MGRPTSGQEASPQELQHKLAHHLLVINSLNAPVSVRRHGLKQLLATTSTCLENEKFSPKILREALASLTRGFANTVLAAIACLLRG